MRRLALALAGCWALDTPAGVYDPCHGMGLGDLFAPAGCCSPERGGGGMSGRAWRPDVRGMCWPIRAGRRVRAWLAPMEREIVGVAIEQITDQGGRIRVKGAHVMLNVASGDRWEEE